MKKYFVIVLGVLFILSFAASAFAIHLEGEPVVAKEKGGAQIILGGKILVRGWYFLNDDQAGGLGLGGNAQQPGSYLPVDTQSQAFYTTNANLTFDAIVSDNVRGFMELETSSGGSGNGQSGLYFWGTNTAAGATSAQDQKPAADLFFRQLWIQYTGSGLLGAPSGIKVGHMFITLGEKQFINNERFGDDAILLWVDPTKELHLVLGTAKLNEGIRYSHTDDIDGYVLIATYMLDKDNTIGANYTLVHSDGLGDYTNLDNLSVHANGKASGLSYAAEVDFQFGKISGAAEQKFRGYAILAKLGYAIDPINIRASFAYGTGDDDAGDNTNDEFQTLVGNDMDSTARFVHYTQIYERSVRTTAQDQSLTGNIRTTGIANTTYYNVGLDLNPVKEVGLSLDGFYIRATESPVSSNAGLELDFRGTYQIAKNLSYFVEAGAFWPGKYYSDRFGIDKETVTQAVHGLLLTF